MAVIWPYVLSCLIISALDKYFIPKNKRVTLKMVGGLIILLIAISSIINVFFYQQQLIEDKELAARHLAIRCKNYCEVDTLEYCFSYFEGDWNNNKMKNDIVEVGT
ncbi:MAG: hypothetical protein KAU95_02445, partial [Candidatus Aenigmarchaeota archaeon]|nr:hypothetical protein [Candidatus Aenigmarchaeota archaeon]